MHIHLTSHRYSIRSWYQLPWTRAAPYIIGILLAFAYLRWLSEQIPFSPPESAGQRDEGTSELTESLLKQEPTPTEPGDSRSPDPVSDNDDTPKAAGLYQFAIIACVHLLCIAGISVLFWLPVTNYQQITGNWSAEANVGYVGCQLCRVLYALLVLLGL